MGILDVIKRWFGGGKSAPVKTSQPTRAPVAAPTAPLPKPAEPAPLTAAEALDVIVAKREAAKPAGQSDRREKPRVNARDGTRVLVIDDSPTIVALLKRMLEQNGYRTSEAIDAETGVTMATSDPPDLIFLDIVLPGMNGFEALRRLRRDPATKIVPIVMISGNELATEQFYAQRIGADDFMKKPFSRSEVFARIEKLLDAEKVPRRMVKAGAAGATPVAPTAPSGSPVAAPASVLVAPVADVQPEAAAAAVVEPVVAAPVVEPAPVVETAPVPEVASTPEVVVAAVAASPAAEAAPVVTPAEPEAPVIGAVVEMAVIEADAPIIGLDLMANAGLLPDVAPESSSEPVSAGEVVADAAVDSTETVVASDTIPEAVATPETATEAERDAALASAPAPDADQHTNGAGEPTAAPSGEPVQAVAETPTFRTPDAAQTMIIEETLRAPANDAHDGEPLPMAAVASRVTASPMMSDGASAVAIAIGVSPLGSGSSTSQIISS